MYLVFRASSFSPCCSAHHKKMGEKQMTKSIKKERIYDALEAKEGLLFFSSKEGNFVFPSRKYILAWQSVWSSVNIYFYIHFLRKFSLTSVGFPIDWDCFASEVLNKSLSYLVLQKGKPKWLHIQSLVEKSIWSRSCRSTIFSNALIRNGSILCNERKSSFKSPFQLRNVFLYYFLFPGK